MNPMLAIAASTIHLLTSLCTAEGSFAITLHAVNPQSTVHRAVGLHVTIENVSDEAFYKNADDFLTPPAGAHIADPFVLPGHYRTQLVITRPDGSTLYTAQTKKRYLSILSERSYALFLPNECMSWDLLLGVAWDQEPSPVQIFTTPGEYTIKAVVHYFFGVAESEPVRITVSPPRSTEEHRVCELFKLLPENDQLLMYVPNKTLGIGSYTENLELLDSGVVTLLATQESETAYREYARLAIAQIGFNELGWYHLATQLSDEFIPPADLPDKAHRLLADVRALATQAAAPELHETAKRLEQKILQEMRSLGIE